MRICKYFMLSICIFLFFTIPLTQIGFSKERFQSSISKECLSIEECPIICYHFTGFTYFKEVKWISVKQAEKIIEQFKNIDISSIDHFEKIQRKHEVLTSHCLILDQDLEDSTLKYPVDDGRGVGLFFSKVTGFFGPCSINFLSLFFAAPFFISRAHGVSIHISGIFYPSFDFVSFQLVNMRLLGFVGLLIVFPFLSIGGYMDGVAFLGRIQEI